DGDRAKESNPADASLARMFHESLATTEDMAVLPGVLGCRTLRRTVQVRLGSNPAVARDDWPAARPSLRSRDSNSWNIRATQLSVDRYRLLINKSFDAFL
ncbi:MAG: hypothetical protein P8075_21285, partial [Deltaproteobacteria bacterium]